MGQTTPEEWARVIATKVIDGLAKDIRTALKEDTARKPAQLHDVVRSTASGPVRDTVTLPQAMTTLTESIQQNSFLTHQAALANQGLIKEITELIKELKKSRAMAKRLHESDEEDEA